MERVLAFGSAQAYPSIMLISNFDFIKGDALRLDQNEQDSDILIIIVPSIGFTFNPIALYSLSLGYTRLGLFGHQHNSSVPEEAYADLIRLFEGSLECITAITLTSEIRVILDSDTRGHVVSALG
ncbi:hypothetical protein SISNIDRAFT_485303 [Sistotremastrum niveocremeum HHB9708]|uniref:Uncharacterized protein n=1 Tax=Sistotremastrum niveocremeum HHB9708 TaxID=1314777 RepID=A0A164V037_9AGAM|nr:hypothetical protein SISNIDRAFT_485303 [Sistotremastrum niveocremeum HHB9708]